MKKTVVCRLYLDGLVRVCSKKFACTPAFERGGRLRRRNDGLAEHKHVPVVEAGVAVEDEVRDQLLRPRILGQWEEGLALRTLEASFSAVSKPIFEKNVEDRMSTENDMSGIEFCWLLRFRRTNDEYVFGAKIRFDSFGS